MKKVLLLGLAGVLAACSTTPSPNAVIDPDTGFFLSKSVERKAETLNNAEFKIDLVHFVDDRTAHSFAKLVDNAVLYEYEPDALVAGVEVYVGETLRHHLNKVGKPAVMTTYLAEIDLKYMKTYLARQTLTSGNFGRYVVDLEAQMIVRDATSRVIANQPVKVHMEAQRDSTSGRHPSSQQDAQRLRDLTAAAVKKLAVDVAWVMREHIE